MICALALAFNLVAIAGFYMLLNAQFLALLQVIVYAGAIMVLILFVIMLLNLPRRGPPPGIGVDPALARPLLALAFAGDLGPSPWRAASAATGFPTASRASAPSARWAWSCSRGSSTPSRRSRCLLVVAMIGAVLLAKRRL